MNDSDVTRKVGDRILRLPEVERLTGLSSTTIWRQHKAGRFPAPVQLVGRTKGWRASEVAAWLDSRA